MRLSRFLAALSLGILGLALATFKSDERAEPAVTELAAALEGRRPIEPRLTGGFAYAPCKTVSEPGRMIPRVTCSPPPKPGTDEYEALSKALSTGKEKPGRTRGTASAELRGITGLLWPDSIQKIDASIASLQEALEQSPRDARILSDLAAAYFLKAQENDNPSDLLLALAKVDEAVAADGNLREARFNRALILNALFLHEDARQAWLSYQRLDDDSGWAGEAESHFQADSHPLETSAWARQWPLLQAAADRGDRITVREMVNRFRQAAREQVEQQVLGAWAEAWKKGNFPEALRQLGTANAIGDALVELGGDPIAKDATTGIDEALAARDHYRLNLLAAGYLAYREGFGFYKKYDAQRALVRLDQARDALERAGSPLAGRASFFHACGEYHLDRIAEAAADFQDLWDKVHGNPYLTLLGHIAWMQGLTELVMGDPVKSAYHYRLSQSLFEKAGEFENAVSLNSLLAERLDHLGRNREAWNRHYRSLREAHRLLDPQLSYLVFVVAAQSALQQVGPAVALYFQNEVVRHVAGSNPVLQSSALYWRAFLNDLAGQSSQALADLERARSWNSRQTDPDISSSLAADLAMIEGNLVVASDPARAASLLTLALQSYETSGHRLLLLRAYLARARAYRLAVQKDLAEADLRAGLEVYEHLGEGLSEVETKLAFIERVEDIFDEMVSFQITERGRPDLAFSYADRSRTKILPSAAARLDSSERGIRQLFNLEPDSLPLEEIQRRLPERTVLIQYSVLPDRLLTWVVRRTGFWSFDSLLSQRSLQKRIARLQGSVTNTALWKAASEELSALLIRSWRNLVKEGDLLVFVPDKDLNELSFPCLWDERRRRYLIEDYAVAVTPSATLYVSAFPSTRTAEVAGGGSLLAVGDPAFKRELFPSLRRLPYAASEVARIASLYPNFRLLTGATADKKSFLQEFGDYRVIHIASHALANHRSPLLSMLVLAPRGGDSGALYAKEIYSLKAKRTQVVVLAGCRTAGYVPDREGTTNLTRAFLATGVPTVVASLWDIGDQTSSTFLNVFHQRLLQEGDPVSSLREAQLSALRSESALGSPAVWGAFQVYHVSPTGGH